MISASIDFGISTTICQLIYYSVSRDVGVQETGDEVIKKFNKACIYSGFIDPHITRDKENAQLRRTIQVRFIQKYWIILNQLYHFYPPVVIPFQLVAQRPLWSSSPSGRFIILMKCI